jgi:hypothetical protein
MKKQDVKKGVSVIDRWYRELGTGLIVEVLKTRFKVNFRGDIHTYDYPHAQFLDVVEKKA